MGNIKLQKFKMSVKAFLSRRAKNFKAVLKIARAENRKTARIPSYWALTIIMCLIAIGAVIYENTIYPNRINEDVYSETATYISNEWIAELEADKLSSEKSIETGNMQQTSREKLKATVEDLGRQIEFLKYLQANNVPVYQKEVESDDADYIYIVRGYHYRFDDITFTIADGEELDPILGIPLETGETYQILSDESATDSIFETNLIFYFVAVLLVVICFSDEFSTGTIKLVVSRPVTRLNIGIAKLLSITALLIVSWTLSALVYVMFSAFFNNPILVVGFTAEGAISMMSVTAFNLLTFVDILLVSLGFIAVASFFAVRFKNNILAVIMPFILYFFKMVFIQVIPNLAVLDLFENLKLMEHLVLGNSVYGSTNLWLALLSSCGIMLLFMALAMRRFKRYDMDKLK